MIAIPLIAALQAASAPATSTLPAGLPIDAFDPPEVVCTIADPRLNEASGIVASRANPGLYYTHNDSGGKPAVYVVDREGRIRFELVLEGATNIDWEDIALSPGTGGALDICVADIGDNNQNRADVQVYRLPEPKLTGAAGTRPTRVAVSPTRYNLRFVDGPRNAEALVVHPKTGEGFIVSKRLDGGADVYRIPAPWDKGKTIEMLTIGRLAFPDAAPVQTIVTAADLSPDGTQLVTRSYVCGWVWTLPQGATDGGMAALIRRKPVRIELAAEPQGEAICFSPDGRCLLTISEKTPTRLYECCRPQR